ncbi:MAG: SUMF1/EgtB/PvdO family nonheme iron enzyme, partial [Anaerolineales bacterium]|nr:SUMF1/EgtB/PvdO family nonheme iron enzyme [Anaerolineales bacterium]
YHRFVETILQSTHVADRTVAQELSSLRGNNIGLMSHLAFAMHRQGQAQGREIELDTLRQLLQPDFTDEVGDFVALIHSRGTLVEERDGYYRFIHLAFQEYLVARYLAEDYWRDEGPKATIRFLAAQTPDSWWREVATLLPGYLLKELAPHARRVLYALAGGNDGRTDWSAEVVHWSPDVQLAAAEIAATASLEWFEQDQELRQQLVDRLHYFFTTPDLLNQTAPQLRANAGRALAALGDPRFSADAWYLPNDPMLGFIAIPAGTFTMGEGEEAHQVTLPTFYIARWPVTVAQFRAYVVATGEQPKDSDSLRDPNNHPVHWLTWQEATRYCAWLTATLRAWAATPPEVAEKLKAGWQIMLPSEAEWERAARGTKGRLYPWEGNEIDGNRANYRDTGIGTTSAVGCFPAGATPEGIEDLSGNIWEWTRSRYLGYPYPSDVQGRAKRERFAAEDDELLAMRGGGYLA